MSRVSLVTGGTRGIGYAIAEALLKEGGSVAVTGMTDETAMQAERALGQSVDDPGRVLGLVADVRDPASVEAAVRTVIARFGRLHALVNNAGVGPGSPVAEMSYDEWRRIIDTNLTGVFNCCHAVIPHMRERGSGWIFSVSSLAATNVYAGFAAYSASKAGLNALSEALMQEVRYDGIRVAYVMPGSVATEFSGDASSGADWKLLPEDVAHAIVDAMNFPSRSLPSRIEIRASQPPKK